MADVISEKSGNPLLCYYGECRRKADSTWQTPTVEGNLVFCSMEHQHAWLVGNGEMDS